MIDEENQTLASQEVDALREHKQTTCCIVGGGPAGVVLSLLLARQGIDVTLLESHGDFDRQFRGDSLYPTVLEILAELNLAERIQEIPHTKMERIPIETPQGGFTPIDMRYIRSRYPYIMMVPQVSFLSFLVTEASRYPNFHLVMNATARELCEEGGHVRGVRYRTPEGWYEVHAALTVGADGRFSKVRSLAQIPLHTTPVSIDTIWFRLPRQQGDPEAAFGRVVQDQMVAMLLRTDHWQIAYNIPKGSYAQLRAQGLPEFRRSVSTIMPILTERMEQITEWKQLSLLAVEAGGVSRWYRPGLLLIGDAAHVMSPALGVGVNFAIQDAVVAANVLTRPLQSAQKQGHALPLRPLAEIQLRRRVPIGLIQTLQKAEGIKINLGVLKRLPGYQQLQKVALDLVSRFITRIAALGLWRIHVRHRQPLTHM